METDLKTGKYVVAVSGGVDSMVLLDLLAQKLGPRAEGEGQSRSNLTSSPYTLVVAHFDHGIRPDSKLDCDFVADLAHKYGLPFESAAGKLGPDASEALAREKRYEFLRSVKKKYQADAIITAHHQDDLIETAIINLLRGTGRRGLSSLKSTTEIKRPMLAYPKKQILDYAQKNNLQWREDPTNKESKYFRNYVRHEIVARLSASQRQKLLELINDAGKTNRQIDQALENLFPGRESAQLDRQWFASLPHDLSKEVMLSWLYSYNIGNINRKFIEQLVVKSKTYKINSQIDVNKLYIIKVTKKHLALGLRDR